jgi:hypothetical protein
MENWKKFVNENLDSVDDLMNTIKNRRNQEEADGYANMADKKEVGWFEHWSGNLLTYLNIYNRLKKRNKFERANKHLNLIIQNGASGMTAEGNPFVDSPEKAKHDYHFEKYIPEALPLWKEIAASIGKESEDKI